MNIFEKDIASLEGRRNRALHHLYNCIPFPFERFRKKMPGTEQAKYIIVTANQKVGKTKFVDYVYVYMPICLIVEHPDVNIKLEITYFPLEESVQTKRYEFYCFLLHKLDNKEISIPNLTSVDSTNPISEEDLQLLKTEKYQKYIRKFNEIIEYIDDIKNPTGINKYCREKALAKGHFNYKTIKVRDSLTEELVDRQVVDSTNPYTPDDPELYRFIILDNYSNLSLESGLKKTENIDKMSKYGIDLRNKLLYTFIAVQHQAQAQEGIENFKLDRLKPTSDGLADCKTTTRDKLHITTYKSVFIIRLITYLLLSLHKD